MSKKKVSGNTMTLKDFHGGSIPSDLPLPSAPSLNMRPSDRSGFDRTSSWGNRSRPHALPPAKPFDEKTPFFTHSAHSIGRNFDEDERKPLDAVSAPRRTVTAHNTSATPTTSAWSSPNAVSKLVHSTALDKVMNSASAWQSSAPRVHVNGDDAADKEHYSDAVLARHADRVLSIDDDQISVGAGRTEFVGSKYSDVRPRSVPSAPHHDADGVQVPPLRSFTKLGGSELQNHVPSEVTERPKLKLLPRTKPSESSEPSDPDYGQVHGQGNSVKPVLDGTGSGKEAGQRPKLNLKPRSQLVEHHLEGNPERERNALFGGARPRELVLKERGVDDVVINNLDVGVEHSNRTEIPTARTKKLPDRYAEKNEGAPAPYDRWTGKKPERKEQRVEVERVNAQPQRRNWRSDNRRNVQEVDKQQVSERPPSPKTWRKPVEEPKSSAETGSTSHGKAASAVDLAQAFSRSVSDPRVNDRFSGQRGSNNNGRTQVPFSRLVGPTPTPRPQINGY